MNNMHVGLFVVALALSAVSAYYSILGLAAIFSASWWSVVILASILEVGKLVLASWLYRNWREINFLIRTYLTVAVLTLMLITSVGTFGFLSQAHAQQDAQAAQTQLQLNHIQSQTEVKQQELTQITQTLAQLDRSINIQLDANRAQSALNARRQQQAERAQLQERIAQIQAEIQTLNNQRLALNEVQISQETKLGPIRYVMAIVNPDADATQAVKWLILVLVMVCDPLAVLMVMASSSRKQADVADTIMPGTIRYWNNTWQAYTGSEWQMIHLPVQMTEQSSESPQQPPDLKPLAEIVDQVVTEVIKQRPIFEVHNSQNHKSENPTHMPHVPDVQHIKDLLNSLPPPPAPINMQELTEHMEQTLNNWVNKNLTVTYTADHAEIQQIVNEAIQASVATLKDQMMNVQVEPKQSAEPASEPVNESVDEPTNIMPRETEHVVTPPNEPEPQTVYVTSTQRPIYDYQGDHRIRGGKKKSVEGE